MFGNKGPRGPSPQVIELSARQQEILEQIVRRANSPQWQVQRARIILRAAAGARNQHIANELHLDHQSVRKWRRRWRQAAESLREAQAEDDKKLSQMIQAVLADAPRSGAPGKFTPEQICQIIALACESPEACGRPVTHWTPTELANEAMKRGIVDSISSRSVGRFLKSGAVKTTSVALLAQP